MKNNFGSAFASSFISLVLSLISVMIASGQGSNPPSLSITPQKEPRISVHGLSGARYQLQYNPNLNPTNWQVLTNFILGTSPYTVVDSNAPLAGIRMYRALLLETNATVSYAPTALAPAEIFRFNSQTGPTTINDTLVLNSSTNGVLLQQGGLPGSGISPVTVIYTRLSPFLAQLSVIRPPSSGFPTSQTNYYTLVFSGPSTGFFQVSDGVITGTIGEFSRDQSFIGQQLAPAQPTSGEIYSLVATNFSSSNVTTLVINSPTSGMLISPGNPPPASITPVSIEYQLLGPLSSQMQVIIPPSNGFPTPQTNLYYFVFASTNSGSYQSRSEPSIYTLGPFTRDRSLVGQQLAPAQLTAGEIYSFLNTNGFPSNVTTLVINSPTSGMLVSTGNPPSGSITPVSIEYQLLGPLSSQLQVVIPPSNGFPSAQTNSYYLVYASANSGSCQSTATPLVPSIGPFTRNQSLVGQQIALAQLSSGEIYSLFVTNLLPTNLTTLVINSPTSGMLVSPGNPPPTGASILTVSIEYLLLGPLSSQLQVIIPPSNGFPTPQTNLYYFVYSAANSGSYQSSAGGPAIVNIGPFTRDRSLVGQQMSPTQLTAGESYRLTSSNGPTVLVEGLVINSATNGILVVEGSSPDAGIFPNVALQYLTLGALGAQIQVVIPTTPPAILIPRTNTYVLVYTANNAGQFQKAVDPGMISVGQFLHYPSQ